MYSIFSGKRRINDVPLNIRKKKIIVNRDKL